MAFTDPFIRRPVLATVVSLLIVLLASRPGASCRCANTRKWKTP